FNAFASAGVPVVQMTTKRPTLEDIFIRLTNEADVSEEEENAAGNAPAKDAKDADASPEEAEDRKEGQA
ncbi:MAG: hypothetical protein J6Z38_04495, partial [Lachnospiraceae bacterium]|nr:hypothetical protein [Lachnospiraceae bacterium]